MNEELTEKVESDPNLNAAEKETSINILGDEKKMNVFSAKRTVVKSLLDHGHFEVTWLAVSNDDESIERVSSLDDATEYDAIYSVSGEMPLGLLTIKSKPRSNNNISSVVNSETIDPEAFA